MIQGCKANTVSKRAMQRAEYQDAYREWIDSLTPEEQERVRAMALDQPEMDWPVIKRGANETNLDNTDAYAQASHLDKDEHSEDDGELLMRLVGEGFGRILAWISAADTVRTMGIRTGAVLYTLRPDLINGQTMAEFGKAAGGISRQRMEQYVSEVRETFNINHINAKRK